MPHNRDINYHSEPVQEIMGTIPSWIIRWGVTVIFAVFTLIVIGCCIIRYPQTVNAGISITSSCPPSELTARYDGLIDRVCLIDGQKVQAGELIALLSNDGMLLFPSTDSIAVENRPEYRSAEAGVEVARRNLQIARSSYYPTLSLSAGYGTSYSGVRQKAVQKSDGTYRYEAYPFFRQYLDNGSSYLSLSLNIPIFSGMSTRNSVRRAKNASLDAQYARQTVKKQLSREYEQALIEYQTSCRQYETAREQLAYAEEAARMMTEKYNLGKTDFTSWDTATTELAKAKYALSNTTYRNEMARRTINIIRCL